MPCRRAHARALTFCFASLPAWSASRSTCFLMHLLSHISPCLAWTPSATFLAASLHPPHCGALWLHPPPSCCHMFGAGAVCCTKHMQCRQSASGCFRQNPRISASLLYLPASSWTALSPSPSKKCKPVSDTARGCRHQGRCGDTAVLSKPVPPVPPAGQGQVDAGVQGRWQLLLRVGWLREHRGLAERLGEVRHLGSWTAGPMQQV